MFPTYPGYQMQNPMILPPQQILQANGRASINALKMSPNSSALIADQTQPIVWKCVSDSLGNVTAEPFDISPHKDEAIVKEEAMNTLLVDINERLKKLEVAYESTTNRANESKIKTDVSAGTENAKPASVSTTNAFAKPKV